MAIDEFRQCLAALQHDLLLASDITEAYDIVEHKQPAYLVVATTLAETPDFTFFRPILSQLNVKCIFWDFAAATLFTSRGNDVAQPGQAFPFSQLTQLLASLPPQTVHRTPSVSEIASPDANLSDRIVLIGASTGGVDAIAQIIQHFSQKSPPVMIVQHTGGRFAKSLMRHLDGMTDARVTSALDDQRLETGAIYLAPDDAHHLLLCPRTGNRVKLGTEASISGHRPSVDALFHSAVPFAKRVTAALLTGMGQDGARGLMALRSAGAHTIVQDQATSVVYGMPRIAAEMGAAIEQLPIAKIGPSLLRAHSQQASA